MSENKYSEYERPPYKYEDC
ncbi:hypothetical protein BN1723_016259 [Verticillium longisporum]|uniref:Uncharacterized protein n=1 Tax=Verticillium longisporum TaxID=100787 RepID=A0A0G4NBN3_VERLO|nr:hypothetical protein BN1723_016259 [Verticillium longisporum]